MPSIKVLLIDDDPAALGLMKYFFAEKGYETIAAELGNLGLALAKEHAFDLVLTDLQLPDIDGIDLVKQLKEAAPSTEIIMVSGYGSMREAINAIKAGAFHFVEKPVEFEELMVLVEKALKIPQQDEEIKQLRGQLANRDRYLNIIGGSKAMQKVYEMIDSVAESDANVMIIGESGTGKELIANAIHYKSLRAKKPFVKINCSALPKELIESELFGHSKGAFTGAAAEKTGLIGQAGGGSLLLDEIGEMPVELQPKLLRVLQERVYYRLGSEKALDADFRLISATNRDPRDAVQEGRMREDLYYRINTIDIHVPPLRERAEDLPHLAEYFLQMYAERYQRAVRSISQGAYDRMFKYPWPGNVRELQNVIERSVLLCKGETIEAAEFPFAQTAKLASMPASIGAPTTNGNGHIPTLQPPPLGSALSFKQLGRLIIDKVYAAKASAESLDIFTEIEGAIVSAALESTRGNKQAASTLLGVYRPRLYHMLKKHNLHYTIREALNNSFH
jgi:DNA-binding NtrC family response regulator